MEHVLKVANDYIQTPKGFIDLLFYKQILENNLITNSNILELEGKTVFGLSYSLGQIPLWFFYMDPKNLNEESQTISVGSICYPRDVDVFLKQFCFFRFGQQKYPLFIRHRFYDYRPKKDQNTSFIKMLLIKVKQFFIK